MLNFTVGPVMSDDVVRAIGAEQVPYFRTPEFSAVMLENEMLMKKFAKAGDEARVVFITGSGTAAMEATVMNVFDKTDKVLVVNGGSFGQRFVELCQIHEIPYEEIKLEKGKALKKEQLDMYDGKGFTGFLVNVHETSTGVHYDIEMISEFCKKNGIFLVVDAISSFLADDFDMNKLGVQVMITGSQKALACPPGVSVIVLSDEAVKRVAVHLRHFLGRRALLAVFEQLIIPGEHDQLKRAGKQIVQHGTDRLFKARLNDAALKIRRGVHDERIIIDLNGGTIGKPGIDRRLGQLLREAVHDDGPDIGERIHGGHRFGSFDDFSLRGCAGISPISIAKIHDYFNNNVRIYYINRCRICRAEDLLFLCRLWYDKKTRFFT